MQKTIMIDGKAVEFRSTASTPRLYRIKFRREIFADINKIQKAIKAEQERQAAENDVNSQLPTEILCLFEDFAYIMAKHAGGPNVPESVDEWLDGFETFSIYEVFPQIIDLWAANTAQTSVPAKK